MTRDREKGQAILLIITAIGIFIIGAAGLAVDGAQMYSHRQMAQAAADSAAQAGIMSIFDGTNAIVGNTAGFATDATFTCTTTDARTPCVYGRSNGFGGTSNDTVKVEFPNAVNGVALSGSDPVNVVRVTVERTLANGLIRFVGGPATSKIRAIGVAAITNIVAPIPIVVTHPNLADSLLMNGTTKITICGGPTRSIQVNSKLAGYAGAGVIDLSHAGQADPGDCSAGTGADFGTFGPPATKPASMLLGTTGHYIEPSSRILDPLSAVADPAVPAAALAPFPVTGPTDGCATGVTCTVYPPGLYVGGLAVKNDPAFLFQPGIYYMQGGGFSIKNSLGGGGLANNYNTMCPAAYCAADPNTGNGMLVYNTGPVGDPTNTGIFDISTGVSATLLGATPTTAAPYYGILFFQNRSAQQRTHGFGQGNGCFSLIGTVYATSNSDRTTGANYQAVTYNGNPCSNTVQQGMIIASTVELKGSTVLKMNISPLAFLNIRQVALVK